MSTLTNTSKRLPWVLLLFLLALMMAIISACLIFSRSASDWVSLGAPPSGVASVIAANGSEIWVNSNDGGIYTAAVTFHCETGKETCWEWQPAETLPNYAKPISDESTGPQSNAQCDTLYPNHPAPNPNGEMIECIYSPALAGETIAQFYFALMSDDTILFLDNSSGFNPFLFDSLHFVSGLLEPAG